MITGLINDRIQKTLGHDIFTSVIDRCSKKTHGLIAVTNIIGGVCDGIVGVGAGLATLATLGTKRNIFLFTQDCLFTFGTAPSNAYVRILKVFNKYVCTTLYPCLDYDIDRSPSFCSQVRENMAADVRQIRNTNNFFKAEVISRCLYAKMAIYCVALRAGEGIIGVTTGVASLAFLGRSARLNQIAFTNLAFLCVVNDVFYCAIKIINPRAGSY